MNSNTTEEPVKHFSLTGGTNGSTDDSVVELAKSYILYKIGKYATVTSKGSNGIAYIVLIFVRWFAELLYVNMVSNKAMQNLYSRYYIHKHHHLHQFLHHLNSFICKLKRLTLWQNKHLGSYYIEYMHLDV